MENLLRDGDYVPNGFGGFTRLYGTQEVLARALFRLTCRRGSFPFLPELGSRLQELGREKPSAREAAAKIFCASALRDMELEVDDVRLTQLPDGHARMEVWLTVEDEKQALESCKQKSIEKTKKVPQSLRDRKWA